MLSKGSNNKSLLFLLSCLLHSPMTREGIWSIWGFFFCTVIPHKGEKPICPLFPKSSFPTHDATKLVQANLGTLFYLSPHIYFQVILLMTLLLHCGRSSGVSDEFLCPLSLLFLIRTAQPDFTFVNPPNP